MANSAVSQQIIDAVQQTSAFVFAPPKPGAGTAAGNAIAYEKAAQAAALAVQDAADYQRNVLSISAAAQGKALAMMFATEKVAPYAEILGLAVVMSLAAPIAAGMASTAVTKSLKDFPPA